MNRLPPREYNPRTDYQDRRRFLPYGQRSHPAKMYCALLSDIVKRYTLPGQTILDPCLGVGTTMIAMVHGRNVVGVELEKHHAQSAEANAKHIARIARALGQPGDFQVWQGDSRDIVPCLGPARPYLDGVVTSSPFGEMNAEHAGGAITQRPNKDGVGFEGSKAFFTYGGGADATITSPAYSDTLTGDAQATLEGIRRKVESGQLRTENPGGVGRRGRWGGGLPDERATAFGYDATLTSTPYGDALSGQGGRQRALERGEVVDKLGMVDGAGYSVDANVLSPTYADTASRDRHLEPYAQGLSPERKAALGQDSPSRNVSGYGKNAAQVGNMKLGDGSYQDAMTAIYRACYEATRDGGILVSVTGDYIREGQVIDLAAVTIDLCKIAGWTPVERWRANKRSKSGKPSTSFWRISQHQAGAPLIDYEDVLVFSRGEPGWEFKDL